MTDSGAYRFAPCPFCGSEIQHIESVSKSFDPPRIYHEWRHVEENQDCWIYRRHHIVGVATDDVEMQAAAIRRWNRREQTVEECSQWIGLSDKDLAKALRALKDKGGH